MLPSAASTDGGGDDVAPSDYSSCDGSDDERYSSANSFLDSARSSSFSSRSEFLDSFRSLSFRDGGRELFGGGVVDPEAIPGGGGKLRAESGLDEDRVLRGRLDELPRIRTGRSAAGEPAGLRRGNEGGAEGRGEPTAGELRSGGASSSTYLCSTDALVYGDAEQEGGGVEDRRKTAVAAKVEAMAVNDCFSSPATRSRESYDFMDASTAFPVSDVSSPTQQSAKIDRIEVVGARHMRGDVSFGERLIGVKEYGVYKLKVHSGENQWEVERRYHDFFLLYCQLKVQFASHGLRLPPPWSKIPRESMKIFGNASPAVIKERSVLIQVCLQSVLSARTPLGTPSYLIWFLSPINAFYDPINLLPESFLEMKNGAIKDPSVLDKMISQMVEVKTHRSKRELLEEQGHTCAGCNKYINFRMSPVEELIHMLGWGRFQVCEFSGQLFCSSCHKNETSVLPARVLHHWDFTLYPVCISAKAFLDSIYNQPILCVGAVNPFLFLKVTSLLNVIDLRKKIGSMLPYVRCPIRRSIEMYFGSRKYLLEANDFFSLRDLVDLSKGAFSELPALLNNLLQKIHEHMMKQCPVCYELGVPCAVGNVCREPCSLLFPSQETGAVRCASCGLIYHDVCFRYLAVCQCGKTGSVRRVVGSLGSRDPGEEIELDGVVDSPTRNSSEQSSGYISELMSTARPDFRWAPRNNRLIVTMNSLLDAFS